MYREINQLIRTFIEGRSVQDRPLKVCNTLLSLFDNKLIPIHIIQLISYKRYIVGAYTRSMERLSIYPWGHRQLLVPFSWNPRYLKMYKTICSMFTLIKSTWTKTKSAKLEGILWYLIWKQCNLKTFQIKKYLKFSLHIIINYFEMENLFEEYLRCNMPGGDKVLFQIHLHKCFYECFRTNLKYIQIVLILYEFIAPRKD